MMIAVKTINHLLPQTQCGECGYSGCQPYAEALAQGSAPIDRCPPGGVDTVKALGNLLNIDSTPYLSAAEANTRPPALALIRESECIGCTKCIQACPVDAIFGSAKNMHVIINHECTGCGLCIEPCPVDCIELVTIDAPQYDKSTAEMHFQAKKVRLLHEEQVKQQAYREKRLLAKQDKSQQQDILAKQDYIQQALARVQAKRLG
jgi:electron transport complex protein RnfB